MPTLNWIGKEAVVEHHRRVPTRLLQCDRELSFGDPDAENLLVEGDNLEALKALLPRYRGQVKCIYIDPPYNTGNENWVYNDNVNDPHIKKWLGEVVGKEAEDLCRHDKWLCMMYPRLALLREFLRDDGAIFVSIDDNELHAIRYLLDEVLGARNFVAAVIWQKVYSPKNSARHFSEDHDYVVVYAKSADTWRPNLIARTAKQDKAYKNPDNDPRGPWKTSDLSARNFYSEGTVDEIGETDLMETNCPVRYVITVDKLREGWDCPLAYVLGSIGNAATPVAVEQLIGRVLRLPFAAPTRVPALDRAYAFVLSDDVVQTAVQLRDRMVEKCGFDARSALDALRVAAVVPQTRLGLAQIPLTAPPPLSALPPSLAERARYDADSHSLVLSDLPGPAEIEALRNSLTEPADRAAVDAFWRRERPLGIAPKNLGDFAPPFRVPRLTVREGDRRALLEPEELDTFSWRLDRCDAELTESEFSSELRVGTAATIDLEGEALITEAAGEVRLRQLELIGEGEDWDIGEWTRWLDAELHRGDSFRGLPLAESQPWLRRVVDSLTNGRGIGLPLVVRRRHSLAEVVRSKIAGHGRAQVREAMNRLIRDEPDSIQTSDEFAISISEQSFSRGRKQAQAHGIDSVDPVSRVAATEVARQSLCRRYAAARDWRSIPWACAHG